MKKKVIALSLIVMLTLGIEGCQKEDSRESDSLALQETEIRSIVYYIDGVQFQRTLVGEQEWNEFLDWFLKQARNGHRVSIRNAEVLTTSMSKDVQTFETTSESEALAWCNQMIAEGYEVSIKYDKKTGIYTCTAIR